MTILLWAKGHNAALEDWRTLKTLHHLPAKFLGPTSLACSPDLVAALAIPHKTKQGQEINEHLCEIELEVGFQLRGSIVPRKSMVPIVPTLAEGKQGNPPVFSGAMRSI